MPSPQATTASRIKALHQFGQSIWLDYIQRSLIISGELKRLVEEDGVRGLTSNPAIFEKAIAGSDEYNADLKTLAKTQSDPKAIYEHLAIQDIQDVADVLRPLYDESQKGDGYVSLEVSPYLAQDTQGTLEEAHRLWQAVQRPNLMIKVPGTPEGIPAIQTLITEGINVNVTLLFAQDRYAQVAEAYIQGLEQRAAQGGDLSHIASVASFFISRIDTLVDQKVEARLQATQDAAQQATLKGLLGKVAIANAKQTYQRYKQLFSGPRWQALAQKGAKPQRVLWASTSTKNPQYRDVLYVEELIGPNTVNTTPPATLEAFGDHGQARASLEENVAEANRVMTTLGQVGVSMQDVTDELLRDAVRLFSEPFDKLLETIQRQCADLRA